MDFLLPTSHESKNKIDNKTNITQEGRHSSLSGEKEKESSYEIYSCIHINFLSFRIVACLSGGSLSAVVDKDDFGIVIAPSTPYQSIVVADIDTAIIRKTNSFQNKRNEDFVFERKRRQ